MTFPAAGQRHENDSATMVIVCAPSALSKMMGSLHPAGALYERPVNIGRARLAHKQFVEMINRKGAKVLDVRSVLTHRVNWSVGDRLKLEELAIKCLKYVYRNDEEDKKQTKNSCDAKENDSEERQAEFYVSDEYKRHVIAEMGVQQLVDIIFTNPTVTVSPSQRDTGFTASYQFDPLSNIVFVRDQQITTKKGIVMARLRSPQRAREVDIMQFCFNKMGLNVVGKVPSPGFLEGGDFFPVGDDLCLIGIGPRSDWNAAKYLLENDLLGTDTVAIVKDEFDQKQERMHLDTVFNILGNDCCLMLDEMIGEESPTRRLVDEYKLVPTSANGTEDDANRYGNYVLHQRNVEFSSFMKQRGFHIITVSGDEQLEYGCNVLNLGGGKIVSIEKNTARRIASSPHFKGTVEFLDFSPVTTMYGGVHCASQVVARSFSQPSSSTESAEELGKHIESIPISATTYTDEKPNGSTDS